MSSIVGGSVDRANPTRLIIIIIKILYSLADAQPTLSILIFLFFLNAKLLVGLARTSAISLVPAASG